MVKGGGKGGQVGKRMPAGRKMVAARPSTSGSSHDEDGEEPAAESQVFDTCVYDILCVSSIPKYLCTHELTLTLYLCL